MILEAGAKVDRYTLVSLLGEGGQAQVWRAVDPLTPGQSFALKLLWLDAASAADIERARREAHHLARLTHPALPACHALFEDLRHNLLGLVLDFVEGTPLDRAVDDPRFQPALALPVVRRMAEGLAYLHGEGLVHRDVKPANVLLSEVFWSNPEDPYSLRLIDLGISVTRGNPRPLTVIGGLIGTPPFMPPEQIDPSFWRSQDDTPSADVFALGVVAWWLLYRSHPTGVGLNEPLNAFARAYRAAAGGGWPPETPPRWAGFFRHSLALAQGERAPSAAPLLALLDAPPGRLASLADQALPPTGPQQPVTGAAAPLTGPSTQPTGPTTPITGPATQPTGLAASVTSAALPPTGPSAPLSHGLPRAASAPPASLPAVASAPFAAVAPTAHEPLPRTLDDQPPAPAVLDGAPLASLQSHELVTSPPKTPAASGRTRRVLLLGVMLGALLTLLLTALLRPANRRKLRRNVTDPERPR